MWNHTSFLVGVSGNIFLLYATVFHKALKLDGMSVWIVQNLALADLLNCVFVLGVVLVSYDVGRQWVFGKGVCTLVAIFYNAPRVAEIFLLCALSVNKLLRCVFPFRFMVVTRRAKITIATVAVFLSLIPAFYKLHEVYVARFLLPEFNHRCGVCDLRPKRDVDLAEAVPKAVTISVLYGLFTIVPSVVIVFTNTYLVVFASRRTTSARGINRRNLLVLAIISAAFISSLIPSFYLRIVRAVAERWINPAHMALAFFWTFSSAWINPIIHLASSPSLRKFSGALSRRLGGSVSKIMRSRSVSPAETEC